MGVLEPCPFCGKVDKTEKLRLKHLCTQKRRYLAKDEKHVVLGFRAYLRFYSKRMPKASPPSYEHFSKSSLYNDFVGFGKHLLNINAINTLGFADYLIRLEVKIADWQKLSIYEMYVRELSRNEPPADAMERNIMLMQQWSLSSGEPWTDFFSKVAPAQAALWIKSGRLSPWVLFTASSATALFQRLSPEQTAIVEQAIDPTFWRLKLDRHTEEVDHIRTVLTEAGM